jgi:hypothetical protein
MEEKIDALLQKYSNEQIQVFLFNFFKIQFSLDELDKVMPFIRSSWKEGIDISTRDTFIKKLESLCSPETMNKIYRVIDLAVNYYGFKL